MFLEVHAVVLMAPCTAQQFLACACRRRRRPADTSSEIQFVCVWGGEKRFGLLGFSIWDLGVCWLGQDSLLTAEGLTTPRTQRNSLALL